MKRILYTRAPLIDSFTANPRRNAESLRDVNRFDLLGYKRKRLKLDLHIILIACPCYQDLAVNMQPTRKPRFDEAFCVSGSVRKKGGLLRDAQHAILHR
jgi:hypothetical protein